MEHTTPDAVDGERPRDRNERLRALGSAMRDEELRYEDPLQSTLDLVRWAAGFGRKRATETALGDIIEADEAAGDDPGDTLVMRRRLEKGTRLAPRVFYGAVLAIAVAETYGTEIKEAVTHGFHTTVDRVEQVFQSTADSPQ